MKSIKKDNVHAILLEKKDNVLSSLTKYIKDNKIGFGKIEGIGKFSNIKLGFLNDQEEYSWKTFEEGELLTFMGNITWADDKPVIHAHATFALADYSTIGGHFGDAEISVIGEFFITELGPDQIKREKFDTVKFKIWDI